MLRSHAGSCCRASLASYMIAVLLIGTGLTGPTADAMVRVRTWSNARPPVQWVSALTPGLASAFPEQVVELTNQERSGNGLPPLKLNDQLAQAAQAHSSAMATQDFMEHTNPATRSTPEDRVRAAGYDWSALAENVAAGQPTPVDVVTSWMNSPGHRANILDPDLHEIGVGYTFDADDAFPCGGQPCDHYWVQDFGTRQQVYPLVIASEAVSTTTSTVSLYLYGQGWAEQMRFRNDDDPFSPWEPFTSSRSWQLPQRDGAHLVTAELRRGTAVLTASDTIILAQSSSATPPEQGTAVQQVTAAPPTPAPALTGTLALDRQATPARVAAGEEVMVTLQLRSTQERCPSVVARVPVDVVLVIDRSPSMNAPLGTSFVGTKLEGAREAAKSFVDQVDVRNTRVAVVQFDESASLLYPLTDERQSIKAALDRLVSGSGTRIDAGLSTAREELAGPRHRPDTQTVIVLLSDGESDPESALREAEAAKRADTRIVMIGLGTRRGEDLLRDLATDPDKDYYAAEDTARLADIYRSIAETIQENVAVTDLVLEHSYDASHFELIPDSVDPPGQMDNTTITWNLDHLDPKVPTYTFRYRLRSRLPGSFRVGQGDQLSFVRCEQAPEELHLGAAMPLLVGYAAAPTAAPNVISPSSSSPTTFYSVVCGGFPWWIAVAVLLILLFLWLAVRYNLAGLRTWLRERRRWPRWCEVAGLAIPAYLLFLVPLALSQFLPLACQPREALYFWRTGPDQPAQVMTKPLSPDLPPQPMRVFDRQVTCVACHAVSTRGDSIAAVANGATGQVLAAHLDGKPIPIPAINASFLSWSPEGDKLAFSANDRDIAILDVATGAITPLAGASNPSVVETMPAWSSDGKVIAFVRPVSGSNGFQIEVPTDIYVVPATGGTPTLLAGASGNGFNYYPSFSPDGRWLAFTRHTEGTTTYSDDHAEIFIVPAGGGEPRRLSANDGPGGQPLQQVGNSWPTWSLDGSLLAFTSTRNGGQDDIFTTRIDANGNSGPAVPLSGATDPSVSEHLPFWGQPPRPNVIANLIGLWPWLLPIPLMVLLARICCQRKPRPRDTLSLDRRVSPNAGRLRRDEFQVTLTLRGNIQPCAEVRKRTPVDVALVIDVSGSMAEELGQSGRGNKLDGAKRAAQIFVDRLDLAQDQVAVIPFSDDAQLALSLANDKQLIRGAIGRLATQGGTSIHAGLATALQALTGSEHRPEAVPGLILLSDGGSHPEPALELAANARDAGVRVIAIGLGASANQGLLQSLASQPGDYYFSPDTNSLETIYRSIAETFQQPVAATNVDFEHTFDAANFELVQGSVFPPAAEMGQGTIIWRLGTMGPVTRSFRYRLRPLNAGSFQIDQGDRIDYQWCGEELRTLRYGVDLPVTVRTPRMVADPPPPPTPPPDPWPIQPPPVVWEPDEALVIGVGGTGRWVLTHVKKNLQDAGAGRLPARVPLMVVDTSEYELIGNREVPVEFAGVTIEPDDVVVLNENLRPLIAQMADDPDAEPELRDWFPVSNYQGLGEVEQNLARGTHGRRPMARVGLVREAQEKVRHQGPEAGQRNPKIWRLLTDAARTVQGDAGIRIIIVGSLAGGMSGTLFDIAYLARRAARAACGEDVSVTIEAYLALHSMFTDVAADRYALAANTYGALRELLRFQLNPRVPYPMGYHVPGDATNPAGACNWRLFDDVFLFGHEAGSGSDPRIGAFPAIADIITLRLDKASGGAGPADWNNAMRSAVDAFRRNRHELAVGTAGSYVYRLPAYDIMEEVKTRWVRALLQLFLVGDDGEVRFQSSLVRDQELTKRASDPAALVLIFLNGGMRAEPVVRNLEPAAALASLLGDPSIDPSDDRLEMGLVAAGQQDMAYARAAFDDELTYTLQWILNGTEQAEATQARAGKIAYALEFVQALITYLDDTKAALQRLASEPGVTAERGQRIQNLEAVRGAYHEAAEAALTRLRGVARALSRAALRDTSGNDGLYDALERRADHLEQRRAQMDSITVRRYLWTLQEQAGVSAKAERNLADIWYQDFAVNTRSPARFLDYLRWMPLSDGAVVLTLLVKRDGHVQHVTLRDLDGVPAFLDALLSLAGSVLNEAWQAHRIDTVMASHGLVDGQGMQVARQMWEQAHPILHFDPIRGGASRWRAILGTPERFPSQGLSTLLESVAGPQRSDAAPEMLATTDPFACQLVRTADAVALGSIFGLTEGADNARERYIRDNERRVVFPAEVEAEVWERHRRGGDRAPTGLILHPLVVAGLAEAERARCFALAIASGLIKQYEQVVVLTQNGQPDQTLVRQAPDVVDPLVMAYLLFTLAPPQALAGQLDAICAQVRQADADRVERWRTEWAGQIPATFTGGRSDREALGRLIHLMVRDELARRFRS